VKVVLAGGTGSLGRRLADRVAQRGDQVVILTRHPREGVAHRQVVWDGRTVGDWADELAGATVVNLAGALVDRRPTAANIELLRASRVEPTRALIEAAERCTRPPSLWLQMSTLAIYGDAGETIVDETHPVADGPPQMAGVARPWEDAAHACVARRVVIMRTGLVLDRGTPAFERLARLSRFGLGGRIAGGDQWVSWIHVEDFLGAVERLRDDESLAGVVHVTAPNPVHNRDLMAAFRHALHRGWSPPTPRPLVNIGALMMRTDPALALTGRRCVPRRLADAGFSFTYPTLESALGELLGRRDP
jgi:uncharacterized protein (TIGR01777 family)